MPLFKHQEEGMALAYRNFKSSLGFILSYSMGLGKTLTAIMTYRLLRRRGLVKECLVVIPRALIPSWKQELSKYFGRVQVYKSGKRKPRFSDVVITTYDILKSEKTVQDILNFENPMIVCDEAHDYCTKTRSQRFAALFRVRQMYRQAFFLMLTGTPIRNKPEDLYALVSLAAPKLAGKKIDWAKKFIKIKKNWIRIPPKKPKRSKCGERCYKTFEDEIQEHFTFFYCPICGQRYKKISMVVGYRNQYALKQLLKEVMLVKTKEECLDLPPKRVIYLPYELEQTRARYAFASEDQEGFSGIHQMIMILSGSA